MEVMAQPAATTERAAPAVDHVVGPSCARRTAYRQRCAALPAAAAATSRWPWIVEAGDSSFVAVADQATLPVLVDLLGHPGAVPAAR